MVCAKYTRFLLFIVGLLGVVILFNTCNSDIWATEDDCNDCYYPEPDSGNLKISLNPAKSDSAIIVKIFEGKLTDDMISGKVKPEYWDTISESSYEAYVKLDNYYSVIAVYYKNGQKYQVVDGSKIKAYNIESTCNEECWIVKGGDINCKLNY
jgi:hypothetical protein